MTPKERLAKALEMVEKAKAFADFANAFVLLYGPKVLDASPAPTRAELEEMPPELAVVWTRRLVETRLAAWMESPKGNFPLCVLPEEDAASIGARVRVAVISAETMEKQKNHHPELTVADYAKAQEAIDNGENLRQDERNIAYVLNIEAGVAVIVKATVEGDELYVTSVRRMSFVCALMLMFMSPSASMISS